MSSLILVQNINNSTELDAIVNRYENVLFKVVFLKKNFKSLSAARK